MVKKIIQLILIKYAVQLYVENEINFVASQAPKLKLLIICKNASAKVLSYVLAISKFSSTPYHLVASVSYK